MFKLKIYMSNAAFEDGPSEEVARILRKVADQVEATARSSENVIFKPILDLNGNTVGSWELVR